MKYGYHIIFGCWIILAAVGCRTTAPQRKTGATKPAPKPTPETVVVVPQDKLLPLVGLWTKRSSAGEESEYRISVPADGPLSLSAVQTNVSIENTHFDGEELTWRERSGDSAAQMRARLQSDGKTFVGSSENGTEFRLTMVPEKTVEAPVTVTRKPEVSLELTSPLAGVWAKEWFVGGGYEYRLWVGPDGHLSLSASLEGITIENPHFDGVKLTWTERAGGLTEQSTARLQPDGVTFVGLAWNAELKTTNKFRMEKVSK